MSRANAPAPARTPPGTRPRAANGQQPVPLGLLAGTSCAWRPRTEVHTVAANISRLPARRVVSRAPRCRSTRLLALDLVKLAFAVPSPPDSIASCSASRGSHCSMASSSLRSSTQRTLWYAGGRVRRLDCQDDRCHRTYLNGAAGRWGHLGWPGFVTIQRRRRWSRLATGYWWCRRRSAALLVAA